MGAGDKNPRIIYWLGEILYLNITNQCTNNCYFCLRKFRKGIAEFNLNLEGEPSLTYIIRELEKLIRRKPWEDFVFCGFGEPTIRLDTLLSVTSWLRKSSWGPVRVDTNGHALLLYPGRNVATELKSSGVDRVSVSLNAHNEALYNEVCQPKFKGTFGKVLRFIECARDTGLDVELTTVTIPEIQISKMKRLASELGVDLRVRQCYPCIW